MTEPSRESVEAATARIGDRVSELRNERGIRVSDLARKAGVSPSMISQIERGQSRPSVGTLFALAHVLNVPVDTFFAENAAAGPAFDRAANGDRAAADELPGHGTRSGGITRNAAASATWPAITGPSRHVVRANERASIDIRGGVRWERLTRSALDGAEFLELVYAPGAESDSQPYRHPGVEMVLVTQGQMTIELGFERYELAPGDSIAFASSTPHRYVNETELESRATTVIIHDELSSLGLREQPVGDDEVDPA